jgi:serine/threonine-protein kinase
LTEVYLARHEPSGELVVIKQMRQDRAGNPAWVDLFLANARTAALFHHPHLVSVREIVELQGRLAVVEEFVDGWPLRELVRHCRHRSHNIPCEIIATIVAEVAEALHFIHELCGPDGEPLRIVHRSVSLNSIILTREGIVRLLGLGANASDVPLGDGNSLQCLTPEAVLDRPLDRRADLFNLGVVFYELLTLQPCFECFDPVGTLDAILYARCRPAREWRPSLPAALEAALTKMLARRADDRWATAAEVSSAMWQFLVEREPVKDADIRRFASKLTGERLPSQHHHTPVTAETESERSQDRTDGGDLPADRQDAVVDMRPAVANRVLPVPDGDNVTEEWTVISPPRLVPPYLHPLENTESWKVLERGIT